MESIRSIKLRRSSGSSLNDTLPDSLKIPTEVPRNWYAIPNFNTSNYQTNRIRIYLTYSGEKHMPMLLQGSRMFRIDPEKLIDEVWRGYRLNLKAIQYSDAKWKELSQQPPPEDPQVTAAKVKAELEMKRLEMTHDYNMKELALRREIAQFDYQAKLLQYSTQERVTLAQAKKDLAEKSMELATQKELFFSKGGTAPEVATPPMEPVGRAPEGEAYQK